MNGTVVIFAIIWGVVCYDMAEKRNHSPILGLIGGLLFGLLAVIYYWLADERVDNVTKKGR
jgi:hypothetical protein